MSAVLASELDVSFATKDIVWNSIPQYRSRFVTYRDQILAGSDTSRSELTARGRKDHLVCSGLESGGVTSVDSWDRQRVESTEFYLEHKKTFDDFANGGYWLFKPYIILQALLDAEDGEFVIYHDLAHKSQLQCPPFRISRDLTPALDFCRSNDGMLPGVYIPGDGSSRKWTKRDCFVLMDCDDSRYWDHCQIQDTFSIWQRREPVIKFVEKWLDWCAVPEILAESPNQMGKPNFDDFVEHRQVQSVLTNLVIKDDIRCYGSNKDTCHKPENINFLCKGIAARQARLNRSPNLMEICRKRGSDKLLNGYLNTYQYWMEDQRDEPVKLLEVADNNGASLKMWRDYFPSGEIHGVDRFEGWKAKRSPERIYYHQVDQENRLRMEELAEQMKDANLEFDFIIDGGSHLMRDQQISLSILFPLLKPGGIFIMEDVHTSFPNTPISEECEVPDNTTLQVLRKFQKTGSFESQYHTRSEQAYLNEHISEIITHWYRKGMSGASLIFKAE